MPIFIIMEVIEPDSTGKNAQALSYWPQSAYNEMETALAKLRQDKTKTFFIDTCSSGV